VAHKPWGHVKKTGTGRVRVSVGEGVRRVEPPRATVDFTDLLYFTYPTNCTIFAFMLNFFAVKVFSLH